MSGDKARFQRDRIEGNRSDIDDPGDFIADKIAIYSDFPVEKWYLGDDVLNILIVHTFEANESMELYAKRSLSS